MSYASRTADLQGDSWKGLTRFFSLQTPSHDTNRPYPGFHANVAFNAAFFSALARFRASRKLRSR